MTEEMHGLGDPVIQRLQQAFSHEEPATELVAIIQRAARYQELWDADEQPSPRRDLTEADLVAARQREPAAVTRVYTAYAPALFRFFMAELGNHQEAQDLTGSVFVSAIEGLPRFRGPVQALGGWLFRIARNDLYDHRRKQGRTPGLAPLDDHLDEAAVAAGAEELPGQQAGTRTVLRSIQVVLDREGVVLRPMFPQLVRWLLDMGDRSSDPPLRLSPREREVLVLLGRGWSNAQIGRELYLSPFTVRTYIQNLLQKLEMHAGLEAATSAMRHGWPADAEGLEELALESLEESLVMAALQQLVPDQREVLLLRMASGLTVPEVAATLGKTTGTVKALQHRGLASLARILGLHGPHEPPGPPSPSSGPDHLRSQKEQQA
jgi:DNA-directed RNA polymerase specialized sigma24 family protein